MAELIIHRKRQFANGLLEIQIFLNNKKIGNLRNGETKKWKVPPGKHKLIGKANPILKTQTLSFSISEEVKPKIFQLKNFGGGYVKNWLQFEEIMLGN